jgi:hypothetical protein
MVQQYFVLVFLPEPEIYAGCEPHIIIRAKICFPKVCFPLQNLFSTCLSECSRVEAYKVVHWLTTIRLRLVTTPAEVSCRTRIVPHKCAIVRFHAGCVILPPSRFGQRPPKGRFSASRSARPLKHSLTTDHPAGLPFQTIRTTSLKNG